MTKGPDRELEAVCDLNEEQEHPNREQVHHGLHGWHG
jgi:hypothetical protein